MKLFRPAFTLMEVNLAILIMATGILGMVSLYSLGYRENIQSRGDVTGTGYADAFLSPLVAGLSATDLPWSQWKRLGGSGSLNETCDGILPAKGWGAYAQQAGGGGLKNASFRIDSSCNHLADIVFSDLLNGVPSDSKGTLPNDRPPFYALVATRRGATITLAFRASQRREQLMSQPIFYTEVHFQGDPTK